MFKTINGWTKARMTAQIRLRNDGTKSVDTRGRCVYQSPTGNACAVGCFIPRGQYWGGFDDGDMGVREVFLWQEMRLAMPLAVEGLTRMQSVHDNAPSEIGGDMRERLANWINENVEDSAS